FLSERIKELLSSGTPAALAIQVQGESLQSIESAAQDIARMLATVKGRKDVRVEAQTGGPELTVQIRSEDVARFGFRRVQVLEAVQAAVQGAEVGQVYHGQRVIDLRVLLQAPYRRDREAIRNLWLTA